MVLIRATIEACVESDDDLLIVPIVFGETCNVTSDETCPTFFELLPNVSNLLFTRFVSAWIFDQLELARMPQTERAWTAFTRQCWF